MTGGKAIRIPLTYDYEDTRPGYELPKTEWLRWNADGSVYVDWQIVSRFVRDIPEWPNDAVPLDMQLIARLLIAARGKITEVSLAEADHIAEDAAERHTRTP